MSERRKAQNRQERPSRKTNTRLFFLRHQHRPAADHDRSVTWTEVQHGRPCRHQAVHLLLWCTRLMARAKASGRREDEVRRPSFVSGGRRRTGVSGVNRRGRKAHPRITRRAGAAGLGPLLVVSGQLLLRPVATFRDQVQVLPGGFQLPALCSSHSAGWSSPRRFFPPRPMAGERGCRSSKGPHSRTAPGQLYSSLRDGRSMM